MELEFDDGTSGVIGLCIPGDVQTPPLGTRISIQAEAGTEFCPSREVTLREEQSGRLLLHIVDYSKFELDDVGSIVRDPICHTEGDSYWREEALEVTLGAESVRVERGMSATIGGYDISVLAAGVEFLCPKQGWDCSGAARNNDIVVVQGVVR